MAIQHLGAFDLEPGLDVMILMNLVEQGYLYRSGNVISVLHTSLSAVVRKDLGVKTASAHFLFCTSDKDNRGVSPSGSQWHRSLSAVGGMSRKSIPFQQATAPALRGQCGVWGYGFSMTCCKKQMPEALGREPEKPRTLHGPMPLLT